MTIVDALPVFDEDLAAGAPRDRVVDMARRSGPSIDAGNKRSHDRADRAHSTGRASRTKRISVALFAAAVGALGLQSLGALASAPPPAPVVHLTSAQAALADALPAHPGYAPVLDVGRVSVASPGEPGEPGRPAELAEPAMSPRTLALVVATLTRAGYTFTTPESDNDDESGRTVTLVVSPDAHTQAAVAPILERYGAHAVTKPSATPAPHAPQAPQTQRNQTVLHLPPDITPEGVTALLRTAIPAPVGLNAPSWSSTGADCITGEGTIHVAARTGSADPVCRPDLNATTWQDYRLIADVTALHGTAVITLRDGRVEVRLSGTEAEVVERGPGGVPTRVLGSLTLPVDDPGSRRVEAGVEGSQVTVAIDGIPVRTAPLTAHSSTSGGVGVGAYGNAAEASFSILGIAGH